MGSHLKIIKIRKQLLTTLVICHVVALMVFSVIWFAHTIDYHKHHVAAIVYSQDVKKRAEFWKEVVGQKKPADSGSGHLAADLAPFMTHVSVAPGLGSSDGILPAKITDADVAPSTYGNVASDLGINIFGTDPQSGVDIDSGHFSADFLALLRQLKTDPNMVLNLTGQAVSSHIAHPKTAWVYWMLFWIASLVGSLIGLVNWTGSNPIYSKELRDFRWQRDNPKIINRLNLTAAIAGAPVVIPIMSCQYVTRSLVPYCKNHRRSRVVDKTLAAHPHSHRILDAQRMLDELENLPAHTRDLPEVRTALNAAAIVRQKWIETPKIQEADQAKVKATAIVQQAQESLEQYENWATGQRELVAACPIMPDEPIEAFKPDQVLPKPKQAKDATGTEWTIDHKLAEGYINA